MLGGAVALALRCSLAGASGDALVGERLFFDARFARSPAQVSCATCHPAEVARGRAVRFADTAERSAIPPREDGQLTTPRHASTLIGSGEAGGWGLLHWDGEFTSMEELVAGTFTGRNFGWRPDERAEAVAHFARVVRRDEGERARGDAGYAEMFRRAGAGADVATASDEQLLEEGARHVAAYVATLRLSRDAEGSYDGSPYDAFLAANRLPRAPRPGETPHEYARRLHAAVAALRQPVFINDPTKGLAPHGQPFRFGELELRGMRIFFRGAMGYVPSASAGNCAECHVPPRFTDLGFHNTGVTQHRYDAVHGSGKFTKLVIPSLAERQRAPERWLPASAAHPTALGRWRDLPTRNDPARADLGLWNVYANPAAPKSQTAIERHLNRAGALPSEEVLSLSIARFKTPSVRNLPGAGGVFLHDGSARTLEDVVELYRQMSDLARDRLMRNAPAEFLALRLAGDDVAPLVAFLQSLTELRQSAEVERRARANSRPNDRGD